MGLICAYIVVFGFFRAFNMKRHGTTAGLLFFSLINMHIACALSSGSFFYMLPVIKRRRVLKEKKSSRE
jgi:hypothetical protein